MPKDEAIKEINKHLIGISNEVIVLSSNFFKPDLLLNDKEHIDRIIEQGDPLALKWISLLYGTPQRGVNYLDAKLREIISQLNTFSDSNVSEYSIWALFHDKQGSLANLKIPPAGFRKQPENIRRWIYRLLFKEEKNININYDLVKELLKDEDSTNAKEGFLIGLGQYYPNPEIKKILMGQFDVEKNPLLRIQFLRHFFKFKKKDEDYRELLNIETESPNDEYSDLFIETNYRQKGRIYLPKTFSFIKDEIISHYVLLIHGIRSDAAYAENVVNLITRKNKIDVIPLRYGYFNLLNFLFPIFTRRSVIKHIINEINSLNKEFEGKKTKLRISVIAHSFGTYVISKVLIKEKKIKLFRLILCGSIVSNRYSWNMIKPKISGEIINECGTKDLWPFIAKSASWGFGSTGSLGCGVIHVRDRFHNINHYEFFKEEFVKKYWNPFLDNGRIVASEYELKRPPIARWKVYISYLPIKWFLLLLIIFFILSLV
jgi:hypothetical protein